MSDDLWESVFRKKARQQQTEAGGKAESDGQTELHHRPPGSSPAEDSDPSAGQLFAPEFNCEICRTDSLEQHLDLLKKMKGSLENIWVSLMIGKDARPKTLMLLGATQGEGASFLSFYLSLFLAREYGKRVLYVDTDMSETQTGIFSSEHSGGLFAFFDQGLALHSLAHKTEFDRLYVLPGGKGRDRASAMNFVWNKEYLRAVVAFSREYFDVAVFDGQPVIFNPAMIEYARAVDQVLLVCRYGQSRREVTKLAVDKLEAGGVKLGGVILNSREYPVPPKVYKLLG